MHASSSNPGKPRTAKASTGAVCAASVALLFAACGDSPMSADESGQCGSLASVADSLQPAVQNGIAAWGIKIDGLNVAGEKAVWVAEDGWIALGPEDVDSLDAVAVVGLTIADPAGEFSCGAEVVGATISTSRRAIGTAAQVDPRLYEYLPTSGAAFVGIAYADQHVIVAAAQFPVSRVIILPNEPPRFGESVTVELIFIAFDP